MSTTFEEKPAEPETQVQDGGARKPPTRHTANATGDDHDEEDRRNRFRALLENDLWHNMTDGD
jgi:hypothetical protein